ncbi:MAG: peptidoglycan-binding domain-containing protein [Pseudomonadota bacterium]
MAQGNKAIAMGLAIALVGSTGPGLAEEPYFTLPPQAKPAHLNEHLGECFPSLSASAPAHHKVVAGLRVADKGTAAGVLQMLEPEPGTASVAQMRQFLRMDAAVTACLPLPVEGPATVRLTAAGNTLTGLVDDAALEVPANTALVSKAEPSAKEIREQDLAAAKSIDPISEESPKEPEPQFAIPADVALEQDEVALALPRLKRAELQTRLKLAGHNPGGADGIFGPRTRAALESWQEAEGVPVSGYFNQSQIDTLETETAEAFDALPPVQIAARRTYYRDRDGCLRTGRGRIVPNRGPICDFKRLFNLR